MSHDDLKHTTFEAETTDEKVAELTKLEERFIAPLVAAYDAGDVSLPQMAMLVSGLFSGLFVTAHGDGWCFSHFADLVLTRVNGDFAQNRLPFVIGGSVVMQAVVFADGSKGEGDGLAPLDDPRLTVTKH